MKLSKVWVPLALSASLLGSNAALAVEEFNFQQHVAVPNGQTRMTFRLRNIPLRDALQLIAENANLNLILDNSVSGTISLDFFQTPLNQILETMLFANGYSLHPYNNSFVVYRSGQYGKRVMRFVPLKFVNAEALLPTLYDLLDMTPNGTPANGPNSKQGGAGGSGGQTVSAPPPGPGAPPAPPPTPTASGSLPAPGPTAGGAGTQPGIVSDPQLVQQLFALQIKTDPHSNRLILVGPEDRVKMTEDLVAKLDVLTPSRIFRLNYMSAKDAIDVLHATFFEGSAGTITSTTPGIGSAHTIDNQFMDLSGAAPNLVKASLKVERESPRFVPLPTQNALFVIGSNADLDLVESVLKGVDRRRPQVRIKVEIVEMSVTDARHLGLTYGLGSRQFNASSDNTNGSITFDTINNSALNFQATLNALITSNRLKVLASPTLLAMDSRKSTIDLTDGYVSKVDVTNEDSINGKSSKFVPAFGSAGVFLELTPRIDAAGGVSMNVHPRITEAGAPFTDPKTGAFIATPENKREYTAQEIYVADGKTIVIAGLIKNRDNPQSSAIPWLSTLPFIGPIFQSHSNRTEQTEVQIYLTPEVIKDADAAPRT